MPPRAREKSIWGLCGFEQLILASHSTFHCSYLRLCLTLRVPDIVPDSDFLSSTGSASLYQKLHPITDSCLGPEVAVNR